MSHTTTIKGLAIKDENAIVKAVNELAKAGVDITLERNTKPGMYYPRQEEQCDIVLRLAKAKTGGKQYDLGFQKQPDGTFKIIFDEWQGAVHGQIGATCALPKTAEDRAMHAIGRFAQSYAKHAAINAATAQGYIVESTFMDAENNIQLVVSV